jgi:hypothetical protein
LRRRPLSKSIGAGRARARAGGDPALPEGAPARLPSSKRNGGDLAALASTWTQSIATIAQPQSALPAPPWRAWSSIADAVSRARTTNTTVTAPPAAFEKAYLLRLPELRVPPSLACMRSAKPRKNPKHRGGRLRGPGRFSIVSQGATAVRQGLQGAIHLWWSMALTQSTRIVRPAGPVADRVPRVAGDAAATLLPLRTVAEAAAEARAVVEARAVPGPWPRQPLLPALPDWLHTRLQRGVIEKRLTRSENDAVSITD